MGRSLNLPSHWIGQYPMDVSNQMREVERLNREEEDRRRRVAREDKETKMRKERRRIEAGMKEAARKEDQIRRGGIRKRPGVLKERQEVTQVQVREDGIQEAAKKYRRVVSSAKPQTNLLLREQAKQFSKRVSNQVQPKPRVVERKVPKLKK